MATNQMIQEWRMTESGDRKQWWIIEFMQKWQKTGANNEIMYYQIDFEIGWIIHQCSESICFNSV